jgi:hypothetical protein
VKPIERVPAMLDGTVQLDHQLYARGFGGLRHRPLTHIDAAIHGRDQKHSLNPLKRPRQRLGTIHVSDHQLGTRSLQLGSTRSLTDDRANRLPSRKKSTRHTAAEHAGCPRDKDHFANRSDAVAVDVKMPLPRKGTAATKSRAKPTPRLRSDPTRPQSRNLPRWDATLYSVITFRDGKISRYREFYDEATARASLE